MADSASCADFGRRAAAVRHRWARANEHLAASKPQGGNDTARRKRENTAENLTGQAGRSTSETEISWAGPGRADIAWDWNLTDQAGLGPVI